MAGAYPGSRLPGGYAGTYGTGGSAGAPGGADTAAPNPNDAGSDVSPLGEEPGALFAVTSAVRLVSFELASGALTSDVAISGLTSNEALLGADFRPADSMFYAPGRGGALYRIDTASGEERERALRPLPTQPFEPSTWQQAKVNTERGIDVLGERVGDVVEGAVSVAHTVAVTLCQVLFIFSPLVTGAVSLAVSPPGMFWESYRVAMTIAVVTTSISFAVLAAVTALDRRRARASSSGLSRGRLWYLGWSLASMPLGLLVAAEVTFRLFGFRVPASTADYRFGVLVGTAITAVFFLWYARRDAEHTARLLQLRLEQAQASTLQAQLSTLTSQLNPHLLFNALNTVASLIASDPERAEQAVVSLAELYRGVLRATQRDEHELGDELAICRAYLDVEHGRFGERLRVRVELEPGLDPTLFRVPVLVLQPLVENAVKHGLSSRSQGGTVTVRAERSAGELRLVVCDDGVGFGNSSHQGAGVGVETTRRRLQHLYGAAAGLHFEVPPTGGTRAVLRLPERLLRPASEDAAAAARDEKASVVDASR